jgi:hypothetical protein
LTALLAAAVWVTLKLDLTSRLAESTMRILPLELPEKMYLPRLVKDKKKEPVSTTSNLYIGEQMYFLGLTIKKASPPPHKKNNNA